MKRAELKMRLTIEDSTPTEKGRSDVEAVQKTSEDI
jgi:hypothetical protein